MRGVDSCSQEGRRPADVAVGRKIAATLADMPQMSKVTMRQICTDGAQEVLLAAYLTSLVRTHVALGEKLGTSQLPIT